METNGNMWKQIRIEHNKTINDVAKAIGCSRQYVSYMESGKRKKTLPYQIYLLELRGEKQDLINANYLRGVMNEKTSN